jgi:hypothetical protein
MADNVPITPGSGADIATDQVTGTGEQVQLVKLAISTDGSRTLIPADGTNGLKTDVSNACLPVGDGTNIITIDTDPGDAEPNSGNAIHAESRTYVYNGTTWDRVRGDISNGMDVDVTRVGGNVTVVGAAASGATLSGNPVLAAGSDGTNARTLSVTTTGELNVDAVGNVAHDTADSGAPVKIGAKAVASLDNVTLVTDGDRTDAYADLDGVLVTKPLTTYGDIIVTRVTNTDGVSTAFAAFGAVASTRNFISTITVYNSSTGNVFLDLRDGTAGTVIYTIPLPALGGATITFPVPLRQPTANTALAYDVSAAATTVYISVVGFQSKA